MKKLFPLVLLLIAGALWLGISRNSHGSETINYRLVTVEQGNLESVVSATGTLDAVTTVQVGTQVSGIINEICVDFNDPVTEGQVVARIDTTLLANAVAGARAQLNRSEAELRHSQREFERIDALHQERLVSESEFNQAQYALDVATATVQASQVDLDRTRQNLHYATITSPIDGTVINRSVDVGQTVQSSFSAPDLFLIAGDLARMQILVAVDESDIGQIAEGQQARFTVQAYPDDTFTGSVRQLRLQAATEENVVNYTAVVDVVNTDEKLLPGMTATVDFLVETATDVLYVTNASLRYKPGSETMMQAMERMRARREANRAANEGEERRPPDSDQENRGLLWTLDDAGELTMIPVLTGISNGTYTVITGRTLEAGLEVIAGVSSSSAAASQSKSPFQQQQGGNRPPGPPSPGGM